MPHRTRDENVDAIEFTGDVDAISPASVSTKGGSLTATLRKAIRDRLGNIAGGQVSTAALTFGAGASLVLLGVGAEASRRMRVSRLGKNRFEIELDEGSDEDAVSDLTAAFLTLKTQQFKDGAMAIRGPLGADEWLAEMNEAARKAEAEAGTEAGPDKNR